jgi:hypothetical protein
LAVFLPDIDGFFKIGVQTYAVGCGVLDAGFDIRLGQQGSFLTEANQEVRACLGHVIKEWALLFRRGSDRRMAGGSEKTAEFARLFLVPGVDHGFREPGPSPVGQFEALVRWVEEGKAPDQLLGERRDQAWEGDRQMPAIFRIQKLPSTKETATQRNQRTLP